MGRITRKLRMPRKLKKGFRHLDIRTGPEGEPLFASKGMTTVASAMQKVCISTVPDGYRHTRWTRRARCISLKVLREAYWNITLEEMYKMQRNDGLTGITKDWEYV